MKFRIIVERVPQMHAIIVVCNAEFWLFTEVLLSLLNVCAAYKWLLI